MFQNILACLGSFSAGEYQASAKPQRGTPCLEGLEERSMPSVTALPATLNLPAGVTAELQMLKTQVTQVLDPTRPILHDLPNTITQPVGLTGISADLKQLSADVIRLESKVDLGIGSVFGNDTGLTTGQQTQLQHLQTLTTQLQQQVSQLTTSIQAAVTTGTPAALQTASQDIATLHADIQSFHEQFDKTFSALVSSEVHGEIHGLIRHLDGVDQHLTNLAQAIVGDVTHPIRLKTQIQALDRIAAALANHANVVVKDAQHDSQLTATQNADLQRRVTLTNHLKTTLQGLGTQAELDSKAGNTNFTLQDATAIQSVIANYLTSVNPTGAVIFG